MLKRPGENPESNTHKRHTLGSVWQLPRHPAPQTLLKTMQALQLHTEPTGNWKLHEPRTVMVLCLVAWGRAHTMQRNVFIFESGGKPKLLRVGFAYIMGSIRKPQIVAKPQLKANVKMVLVVGNYNTVCPSWSLGTSLGTRPSKNRKGGSGKIGWGGSVHCARYAGTLPIGF